MWWLGDPQRTEFTIAMAVLVWIRHHENIRRLLRGEESKIGASRKS
jgi:glycerol-3-phosphate acyltransferase PlsY